MRSLHAKFSALLVAALAPCAMTLVFLGARHERDALVAAQQVRAAELATDLAEAVRRPLEARGPEPEETRREALAALLARAARHQGVSAVRLLDRHGSLVLAYPRAESGEADAARALGPASRRLAARAQVGAGTRHLGEVEIELDPGTLVDPVVAQNARWLGAAGAGLSLLALGAGFLYIGRIVHPLHRLRAGVERLSAGDLGARVPPTSCDEVGELTRAFNEMADSLLEKRRIQSAFGRYVNETVLAQLLENEEAAQAGAEFEVTVLFADIRRFTRLSEGMRAPEVVSLLNEIFQRISDCILECGGTIDKFIGDSVMAYFGAPLLQRDHALRAVAAASAIQRSVAERNERPELDRSAGGVPVEIGIGIHAGTVVVGSIGSDRRMDFTAIGDTVNVAHRLEKLARPGQILVSEAVQRRVRTGARLRFEGERQLAGREEAVHVYSVDEREKVVEEALALVKDPGAA